MRKPPYFNLTKIKLEYPSGVVKVKPWASGHSSDSKHLSSAKEAYINATSDDKVVITLFK